MTRIGKSVDVWDFTQHDEGAKRSLCLCACLCTGQKAEGADSVNSGYANYLKNEQRAPHGAHAHAPRVSEEA
jgi:hypothetical protein